MSKSRHVFQPDFRELAGSETATLEEYGRFQQHIVLLEDQQRVSAYLKAISQAQPGEVVVDVGAGTGLLAIVALKCGFKHAFLVEPSRKIAAYARHLAELNGVLARVTILESKLEMLPPEALPSQVDLVVTETLSSVLFGFGCWDALPGLVGRVRNPGGIIPLRGKLYACLATRDYATRGRENAGLALLKRAGVEIDLFERTFRSGGNIYGKHVVSGDLESRELTPACIARFDFSDAYPLTLDGAVLPLPKPGTYSGLVLYWEVDLCGGNEQVGLTSLDAALTSWYPLYLPFRQALDLADEDLHVRMILHPIDTPYTYAFQFVSGGRELTHILYW